MECKKDREQDVENIKITAALLKSTTGEFDLESILFLKLRGLGICDLGCIGSCLNLERLDLSINSITCLTSLASLKLLTVLNVSGNRITNLEPISFCENLQTLNAAGNLISSFESLHCLTSLKKLESIRFKDSMCNFSNPVCKITSYRCTILEMFPNIKVIDGERVAGRGSDLYQLCKDLDESLKGIYKNGPGVEVPACKPWVEEGFWEIKRSNNAIIEEAYKQFNDVLHECRLLNNRASHLITQTERTLSNKNQTKLYVV
ncbi:leucine-rich repeat-containing protein 61 [Polypterus senegalus]|uniref:leucine-rich repeat-containing protein 61 n=1 Tax=Polypterus senegalus TaxID=55291 RepID=UPI001962E085|nr:leucine-rich repeat-containing protein 61 [Polypterus senegalus]